MEHSREVIENARLALHGRILRCPLGDNPPDCPLHQLRKRPMEERIAWVESRTDEEAVCLYNQHVACMECKLESLEDQDP